MKTIYFLFLLVLTGVGSSIMTLYAPTMVRGIKRSFTRKKRTPNVDCTLLQHNIEEIVEEINEMKQQLNNLAEVKYNREKNRKHNIRREIRSYLEELRTDK